MMWTVCVCCRPRVCERWVLQAAGGHVGGSCGLCVWCVRGGLSPTVDITVDAAGAPLTPRLQCKAVGLQMPAPASFCPSAFSESSLLPCPQQERRFREFMLPTALPRSLQ